MSRLFEGDFKANTSMEELNLHVEDSLINADMNGESQGYSLDVKFHPITEFEDHTGFPRILSSSKLMGAR